MTKHPNRMSVAALCTLFAFTNTLNAQERIDYEAVAKIRREGRANSRASVRHAGIRLARALREITLSS